MVCVVGTVACAGLLLVRPLPLAQPVAQQVLALPRSRPILCAESADSPAPSPSPSPPSPAPPPSYESSAFDIALKEIVEASAKDGLDSALDAKLDSLDDMFIPTLASRIEARSANGDSAESLEPLTSLLAALQERSQKQFERARDQLQTLLGAGEINKLDAQLCGLIKRDELDAGFFYVLYKNMEDAKDDEGTVRMLTHILTRTEEELEKKTEPALGLLHKLTRTDDANIRGNILRNALVPQTSTRLPDGREVALDPPAPAQVAPLAFAGAVEGALDKVMQLPLEREAIASTVEEIRQVHTQVSRTHTSLAQVSHSWFFSCGGDPSGICVSRTHTQVSHTHKSRTSLTQLILPICHTPCFPCVSSASSFYRWQRRRAPSSRKATTPKRSTSSLRRSRPPLAVR